MMNAPLDYTNSTPSESDALGVEAGDILYAALLERHAASEPVTDEMIRAACLRTDTASLTSTSAADTVTSATEKFARLLRIKSS